MPTTPLIGIPCCFVPSDTSSFHKVHDKYVDAVLDAAGGLPFLIPALGERLDVAATVERLDGLMLTGSPSNVDPARYGGPPPRESNQADPARDATTLPLIRACLEAGVPLLAVCRGIQELNVALGGSLHQHVEELPGKRDHRSDKTKPFAERYAPVHDVAIRDDGVLAGLYPGREGLRVNSLHGQGIDRPAATLRVEAVAPDGLIEAVSVTNAKAFALGVQWHPEWHANEHPDRRLLFEAFGNAARERMRRRGDHERLSGVA